MKFYSTQNPGRLVEFKDAVFEGLAPDGGLFVPESFPNMRDFFNQLDAKSTYNEISAGILNRLMPEYYTPAKAKEIVDQAFTFEPKICDLEENLSILELYHGPTCAFKDFGASFLSTVMSDFLKNDNKKSVILTATSGDTGSAVARAFYEKENIEVVILYPSGRVSPLQEKQLTTLGKNIKALEVKGSFDDCQRMVKEAFTDSKLKEKYNLSSANSINLGRLLPQAFYYVYAYSRLKSSKDLAFCVPSGNFGNMTAGLYAWKWGLPVKKFIAATNANDVVPEYLETGLFQSRASLKTYSNAMDVGNPSNFERMKYLFKNDWNYTRQWIEGQVVSDEETLQVMKTVYDEKGVLLDPHTAVGYLASKRYLKKNSNSHVVELSTAHPGKFLEVVEEAVGISPELPESLKAVQSKEKHSLVVGNRFEDLSNYLKEVY